MLLCARALILISHFPQSTPPVDYQIYTFMVYAQRRGAVSLDFYSYSVLGKLQTLQAPEVPFEIKFFPYIVMNTEDDLRYKLRTIPPTIYQTAIHVR